MAGGALGGEDGLAAGGREGLVRDDSVDRHIQSSVAALESEKVAGDVDGILLIHDRLGHASVGPYLERVEDEGAEAIEAVLRLEVAEGDAAVSELRSLGRAFRWNEVLTGRMARDATEGVEKFAAATSVDVHDLCGSLGGALRLQRGEVMLDRDERLGVGLRQHLRHDGTRVDCRGIGDEFPEPLGTDALGHGRERRPAQGGQTGRTAVAVHAAEFVIEQAAAFGRRRRDMETVEARDERFGAQRGGAQQDRAAQHHAVSRRHFST